MARELAQHASNSQAEANLLSYATDLEREADELDDDTPKPRKNDPRNGQGQA